jgi:hypothetical protein
MPCGVSAATPCRVRYTVLLFDCLAVQRTEAPAMLRSRRSLLFVLLLCVVGTVLIGSFVLQYQTNGIFRVRPQNDGPSHRSALSSVAVLSVECHAFCL